MCELQATCFQDYHCESANDNMIYLEIGLDGLGNALRSAEMANSRDEVTVGIKLTKVNNSVVLKFEMEAKVGASILDTRIFSYALEH